MINVTDDCKESVVIIGGGVVGLSIAESLQSRGLAVTVLDANIGSQQASRGNAGQIAPGHPPVPSPAVPPKAISMLLNRRSPLYIPPRPSLALARWMAAFRKACKPSHYEHAMHILGAMSHDSRIGFDRLADTIGTPNLLHPAGVADFWISTEGEKEAMEETRWMETLGFEVEHLSGAALRQRDPAWSDNVLGAVMHKAGMLVDPAQWMDALRTHIETLGGTIRTMPPVTEILWSSNTWQLTTASGQRLHAERIVLCAGTWSTSLAAQLGLRLQIQPAKGYHAMVSMPSSPTVAGVLREPKIAVTPMDATVRLAGTLELSGWNHRMMDERLAQLLEGTTPFLPAARAGSIQSTWCGLRPCTADGLPVVGRIPGTDRAWIATGHGMMGVTLAPATADAIAADMCGEALPHWACAIQPIRTQAVVAR